MSSSSFFEDDTVLITADSYSSSSNHSSSQSFLHQAASFLQSSRIGLHSSHSSHSPSTSSTQPIPSRPPDLLLALLSNSLSSIPSGSPQSPSSSPSSSLTTLLHSAHSSLSLASAAIRSSSPPLALLHYTHAHALFSTALKTATLVHVTASTSSQTLLRSIASLVQMCLGFISGLSNVVATSDVARAAATLSTTSPSLAAPHQAALPTASNPIPRPPILLPKSEYSSEELSQSTHLRTAIREGLRPLHVNAALGNTMSASAFMDQTAAQTPPPPQPLPSLAPPYAAPPSEVSSMLALERDLATLSQTLNLTTIATSTLSDSVTFQTVASDHPNPSNSAGSASSYAAAAALDGSFLVVPTTTASSFLPSPKSSPQRTAAHTAPTHSSRTHAHEISRLLNSMKVLSDENTSLLLEVEALRTARVEAVESKEAMRRFQAEYETRFIDMKSALEKFPNYHASPSPNAAASDSAALKELTLALRKEREESAKKDSALRKYEAFYREVKSRSAKNKPPAKNMMQQHQAARVQRDMLNAQPQLVRLPTQTQRLQQQQQQQQPR